VEQRHAASHPDRRWLRRDRVSLFEPGRKPKLLPRREYINALYLRRLVRGARACPHCISAAVNGRGWRISPLVIQRFRTCEKGDGLSGFRA
jgi:hypothetical protein